MNLATAHPELNPRTIGVPVPNEHVAAVAHIENEQRPRFRDLTKRRVESDRLRALLSENVNGNQPVTFFPMHTTRPGLNHGLLFGSRGLPSTSHT